MFREKIGDRMVNFGLTSLAVLLAFADATAKTISLFPSHRTSLNQLLNQLENRHSKSVSEYLVELKKEIGDPNLKSTLYRLEQKGLINKSVKGYKLTLDGNKVVKGIKNRINHLANWDGKWRLVTFDIPEKRRRDRDWIRNILYLHEYKPLQKSVFIGKFSLPEKIYRSIHERKLTEYIRLLIIGEIDEETYIQE